jgi:hypothetical protein
MPFSRGNPFNHWKTEFVVLTLASPTLLGQLGPDIVKTMPPPANLLFYGDNLDVLRRHIADESVDLVYLDPPFKSDRNYNVLFRSHDGTRAAAQIRAFEDTWQWDEAAANALHETIEAGEKSPRYSKPSDCSLEIATCWHTWR